MQLALGLDGEAGVRRQYAPLSWTPRVYSWMDRVAVDWWNTGCGRCWSGSVQRDRWCVCGLHPDGNCGSRNLCYGGCGLAVERTNDVWGDDAGAAAVVGSV
jgi:hypothetical protein